MDRYAKISIAVLFLSVAAYADVPAQNKHEAVDNVNTFQTASAQALSRSPKTRRQPPASGSSGRAAQKPRRTRVGSVEAAQRFLPRAGDDCGTATPVAELPFADTGNTCGSVDDYDEICGYDTPGSPDVVYVFSPASDVVVNISLCGDSAYDTKLYVYENACGVYQSGTFVACNDDACSTPSYLDPFVSVVSGVVLTTGNTYYIVVDGYGGDCGDYTIEIANSPTACPPSSLLSQPPSQPSEVWDFVTSDTDTVYLVYETFSGLTAPIGQIRWWGFDAGYDFDAGNWVECDEDPPTFEIRFYEDNGGAPGAEVCSYTETVAREDRLLEYEVGGGTVLNLWEYNTNLDPFCSLTNGWVSIQGTGGASDCWFVWLSSLVGDEASYQFDGITLDPLDLDRSLCLSEVIIPRGYDCYDVGCGLTDFDFSVNALPAGFFAPDSEEFKEVVYLSGNGQGGPDYDFKIERLEDIVFDDVLPSVRTIDVELVALDLVSCDPITVQPDDVQWNVQVGLSSATPSEGTLTATKTHANGGFFTMAFSVHSVLTFSRVDDANDVLVIEAAAVGIPPLQLESVGDIPWLHHVSLDSPGVTCGENFAPGMVETEGGRGDRLQPPGSCGVDVCSCRRGVLVCARRPGGRPCPEGACCYGGGLCRDDLDRAGCQALPGDFQGRGTNCDDNDGDGIPDQFETNNGCVNPGVCKTGTSPCDDDTDGDGCGDGDEVEDDTDPCDPCDPIIPCTPPAVDCNGNGTADDCDISAGGMPDTDNNGIPDECDQAACCWTSIGYPVCQDLTEDECLAVGGVRQPIGWLCPTENVTTQGHVSGPFTHLTDPAQQCPSGTRSSRDDCVPGDPIDPWKTAVDAIMCHRFGLDPSECPAEEPDCSPPIPADFFGPGSDPFVGEVCLGGAPLGPIPPYGEFGEADTLVRRTGGTSGTGDPFDRCGLPSATESTVAVEVIALSLVSVAPITVTFNGGQNPEEWDVAVDLSETSPDPGSITAVRTHGNGGTYSSALNVQPNFTFTKVGGTGKVCGHPEVACLDTGPAGIPYITLVQVGAPWTIDIADNIGWPSDICTDFHPGIEDSDPILDSDCNANSVRDKCDIENETSQDCNGSAVPDSCELSANDCNNNTIPDDCDVAETDCNRNGEPDDCDVDPTDPDGNGQVSPDCNSNAIPDECEMDCNGNGVADQCDVPAPAGNCTVDCSVDCNENGMPDECEPDCNGNGVPDGCDIVGQTSLDCEPNGRPDECDIASGVKPDCQGNGQPDECDIAGGVSPDCNANSVPDECEVLCVVDQDCDDSDECTVDTCECGNPQAGLDGCLHAYQQRPYGDVTPFGTIVPPCTNEDRTNMGDGFANMLDVFCAFNAFNEGAPYTQCPCGDVSPCGGDNFVNMLDVFAAFNAFNNAPICPDPCP